MNGFIVEKEKKYMEKLNFKNFNLLILMLSISNLLYSQNQTIVPKNGTIVFVKKEVITDTLLYKSSFEKVFDKMIVETKNEALNKSGNEISQPPDSINQSLNQMFEMMKSITMQELIATKEQSLIKYHHTYVNYEIEEFISVNDKNLNKKVITNATDNGDVDLLVSTGIEEYKNETKVIKGFNCYRVVIYYFDFDGPTDFKPLLNKTELWVTEDIKSSAHPFVKSKEILEKYFPLEAKQTIKDVEGMYISYEISEFSLK